MTGDATGAATGFSAIMNTFTKLETKPTLDQAKALATIGMTAEEVGVMMDERGLMGTMNHLKEQFDANDVSMGAFF